MKIDVQADLAEEDGAYYAGFMSAGEGDSILSLGIQKEHGDSLAGMPGQQYGACLVSSLLGIRAGTEYEEECREFLEYAVSKEFLSEGELNGTPVSREVYEAKRMAGVLKSGRKFGYCALAGNTLKGNSYLYDIQWPGENEYRKLDALLEGITGVSICDTVVYETVVEYGRAVLNGEISIDEAADSIEKRLKIYLAE